MKEATVSQLNQPSSDLAEEPPEVLVDPIVGVDVGGTKILARMVEPSTGRAIGRVKAATPSGADNVLDAVVAVVQRVDGWADAKGIGVGVPGLVESGGVVAACPNIDGWDSPMPVAERLSSRLGKPVVVANDVNCGAVGEHRAGAGRGLQNFLAVFVGTGVGGGLIIDGALAEGGRGMVGEIGHVTVVNDGRLCGCGGKGHLEAYAGRAGIDAQARRRVAEGASPLLLDLAGDGAVKSRHLERGLAENDPLTLELLAEATDALAVALGNAATLLDLDRIVLGGGVMDKLGPGLVDQILRSDAFGGFGSDIVDLVLAQRIDDAGVVGAAIFASDRLGFTKPSRS